MRVTVDAQALTVPARKSDDPWPPRIMYSRLADNSLLVTERGQTHHIAQYRADGMGTASAGDGAILSPMPGRIIAVAVAAGDSVTAGQKLVTLEAMKMEHSLTAPFDGTVAELIAIEGAQVSEGTMLVRIEKAEAEG